MSGYIAKFDRISRNHNVPALSVSGSPDAIAEQVWQFARPKCASRDIEVAVDMEKLTGTIYAGMQVAGHFILEPTNA